MAIFDSTQEVNMVVQRRLILRGELPKSLISLVLGILATISGLLALISLFANLIVQTGATVQEVHDQFFGVLAGLIAGFVLGVAGSVVGSEALPEKNSRPQWKICRICASTGIALGFLAMLIYLVFIALLPVIFPLPR
jgi:hypothetical protein